MYTVCKVQCFDTQLTVQLQRLQGLTVLMQLRKSRENLLKMCNVLDRPRSNSDTVTIPEQGADDVVQADAQQCKKLVNSVQLDSAVRIAL